MRLLYVVLEEAGVPLHSKTNLTGSEWDLSSQRRFANHGSRASEIRIKCEMSEEPMKSGTARCTFSFSRPNGRNGGRYYTGPQDIICTCPLEGTAGLHSARNYDVIS